MRARRPTPLSRLLARRRDRRDVDAVRRGLILGAVVAAVVAGNASALPRFLPRGGATAGPPPVATTTITQTFANTADSDGPANVPINQMEWFVRGSVPAGQIMVPTVGGVIDLTYQADAVVYWGDGSLCGVRFRIDRAATIVAGGTFQVVCVPRAGAYDNASTVTTADVVAETDLRVVLTNLHTATVELGDGRMATLTIGGGQVTGGRYYFANPSSTEYATLTASLDGAYVGTITPSVVTGGNFTANRYYLVDSEILSVTTVTGSNPYTLTIAARGQLGTTAAPHAAGATIRELFPVSGGGGTGAQVYLLNGAVVVAAPGSGYVNVGSGTVTASVNAIVAAVATGGNRANGVRIEQYARGPVCNAWRLATTVPGAPHLVVWFYVERWVLGGSVAYRRTALVSNGTVDLTAGVTWPNYTYDVDLTDGATIIWGTGNGDAGSTTLANYAGSAAPILDPDGRPFWSTNHAAFSAIIPQRTPTECDNLKLTGIILPWMPLVPVVPIPTDPATFPGNSDNNGGNTYYVGRYVPFGQFGTRCPLAGGAVGNVENPMTEVDALYWMELRAGRPANARVWLNNIRVAAANTFVAPQLGCPMVEPTTLLVPNVIPTTARTLSGVSASTSFPSLLPTRHNKFASDVPLSGFVYPLIRGNAFGSMGSAFAVTNHQQCTAYGAYVHEGEAWQADALTWAAINGIFGKSYADNRQVSFGGNAYYGTQGGASFNTRNQTWERRTQVYAWLVRPDAWADGTVNEERRCLTYQLLSDLAYRNDLVPFVGPVTMGSGGTVTYTKATDLTGTGLYPEIQNPQNSEYEVPYMTSYEIMSDGHCEFLARGSILGTPLRTWLDHRRCLFVRMFQDAGSHFTKLDYRWVVLTDRGGTPLNPAATYAELTAADPTASVAMTPAFALADPAKSAYATFTSGSSSVSLANGGIRFKVGTPLAEGSRIRLTRSDMTSGIQSTAPPSPYDTTTFYYLRYPTPGVHNVVQLCAGVDGSGNPDPATAPVAAAGAAGVSLVIVPANAPPADSANQGYYENTSVAGYTANPYNRVAQCYPTVNALIAWGIPDDANGNQTAAAANLKLMNDLEGNAYDGSIPNTGPQYAFDDALSPP